MFVLRFFQNVTGVFFREAEDNSIAIGSDQSWLKDDLINVDKKLVLVLTCINMTYCLPVFGVHKGEKTCYIVGFFCDLFRSLRQRFRDEVPALVHGFKASGDKADLNHLPVLLPSLSAGCVGRDDSTGLAGRAGLAAGSFDRALLILRTQELASSHPFLA